MKALFARKAIDLVELKELTNEAKKDRVEGTAYEVIREIEMSPAAFREFAEDLQKDQPWIESSDGGPNKNGEVRCIRVINRVTREKVLVNSEGYSYPRYTAIEE
jgi:ribosomal protein S14